MVDNYWIRCYCIHNVCTVLSYFIQYIYVYVALFGLSYFSPFLKQFIVNYGGNCYVFRRKIYKKTWQKPKVKRKNPGLPSLFLATLPEKLMLRRPLGRSAFKLDVGTSVWKRWKSLRGDGSSQRCHSFSGIATRTPRHTPSITCRRCTGNYLWAFI